MSRRTKARTIEGPFVSHSHAMRISPAWRHLPDDARRVLDQLEVEHMEHGGTENGRLIRTYSDFERGGIRRASVALAIRQASALGFLEITASGQRSAAQFRQANFYRLTYVIGRAPSPPPTNDWRRIASDTAAAAALSQAAGKRRHDTQPVRRERRDGDIDSRRTGASRTVGAPARLARRPL
ncbi:hypothetical protein [Chelatococcus reniformis]|uniref:Uncharacterized protein n=1 Tax=Chelatococcus reniformis TaxID=1494448 RepID=A0A916UFS0_9HYPH|nr:hypothetical protein [Chelatococcus reniformis]GGC70783.1 hypothetical protein GCM10010994_31680 [Chelatococcus reniformis]